jgi:hypothetical protein
MSENVKSPAEKMGDEILVKILKALVDNGKLIIIGLGGHGKCLDGNTLVSTPNGKVKLSELKIGDEISGIDKNGIVENTFVSFKSTTLLITTKSGKTIRCSPEHFFLTENGYMQAKDLNTSTSIITMSSDVNGNLNKGRNNLSGKSNRWGRNINNFNTTKIQREESTRTVTAVDDYNKFIARIIQMASRPLRCEGNKFRCKIQDYKTIEKSCLPIYALSQFSRYEGIANINDALLHSQKEASDNSIGVFKKTNNTTDSLIYARGLETFSGNSQIKFKQEKITEIQTESNRQKLYDIQTTLRYYIANDIVVHNSNATMHIIRMIQKTKDFQDGKFVVKLCDSSNVWKWTYDEIPFVDVVKSRNIPEDEKILLLDLGFTDIGRNVQIIENMVRGDYLQQREMMNLNFGQLPIRRIYMIEEAQNVFGSYSLNGNSGKFWLKEISEGRNYGQYMIGLGQRFADISTKIVERTRYFLLGAISGENDANKIKRMFSSERGQRVVDTLLSLEPYQFLFLDRENPEKSAKIYFPKFEGVGKPFEFTQKKNGHVSAEKVYL